MTKKIWYFRFIFLTIICIGTLIGLAWGNSIAIHQKPVEKYFLVPWSALRSFLETGENPYGGSEARKTQGMFYGRSANSNEDPLLLSHPFASEILFFPLALIKDYAVARNVWMLILELALMASAFLSALLFEWKMPVWLLVVYILFVVLGVQSIKPLLNNDEVILQSFFFIAGLYFLRKKRDEVAGGLISLTFLTPSATGLFLLFTLSWIILNRRWHILWGMLMTLGFLLLVSFALFPGWLIPFIQSYKTQIPYLGYTSTYQILTKLWPAIGNKTAMALTMMIITLIVLELRVKEIQSARWFIWVAMFSLAANFLLGIPTIQGYGIFLVYPFAYIIKIVSERLTPRKRPFFIVIMLGIFFIIAWMLEIKFTAVIPGLMNILFPTIMIVLSLYWIRWWSIKPYRTRMNLIDNE